MHWCKNMDERREVITKYFNTLDRVKQFDSALWHSCHKDMTTNIIRIYRGDKVIIKVEEDEEIAAYEQARRRIEELMPGKINWISVQRLLPIEKPRRDEDGYSYTASDAVLVWDGDPKEPIALGCLQEGKWYANGVGQPDITHWAYLNDPQGNPVEIEYMG